MFKILTSKRKSISPLIATILLVVVAVILVVVLLNWSKIFTSDTLGKTDIVSFTKSDATYFVYPLSLTNGILQFNYNPPTGHEFGDFIAESYRVITDDVEYPSKELNIFHAFQNGLNIIDLTGFKDLKLDDGIKVTILLESTDHYYVSLTLTNKSTGGDADLPYVMKGNQKLYIQPKGFANNQETENEFEGNWNSAMAYCAELDVNQAFGYTGWRLPTYLDFAHIWNSYKINDENDDCLQEVVSGNNDEFVDKFISSECINKAIKKTYAGFEGFYDDLPYWTSNIGLYSSDDGGTSFSVSGAYGMGMSYGGIYDDGIGDGIYARCVRDP